MNLNVLRNGLAFVAGFVCSTALAGTATWTNFAANTPDTAYSWNDPGNWQDGYVGGTDPSDDVTITPTSASGKVYIIPCLAVALGSEPYSQKRDRWTLEAQKELEGKFVRMLFAFPSADLTDGASMQTLDLEFKIRDTKCQPPPIPFRILPDDQPLNSDPQTLGKNGNCGLTWLELHPEAQPSLDDKPADSAEKQAE